LPEPAFAATQADTSGSDAAICLFSTSAGTGRGAFMPDL
jgi:hypothetical protein